MRIDRTVLLIVSVSLTDSVVCFAQNAAFSVQLAWQEVLSSTGSPVPIANGVLEPGESALVSLSLTFSPPVGQLVTYFTSSTGFAQAPVAGFANLVFAIDAQSANQSVWALQPGIPGFVSYLGTMGPTGSSKFTSGAYQPEPTGGAFPLPLNPLPNLWTATWTPSDYSTRTASFSFASGTSAGSLFVHTGTGPSGAPTFHYAVLGYRDFGTVHIPIAPAPASCLPLFALGFTATRRTRRRT